MENDKLPNTFSYLGHKEYVCLISASLLYDHGQWFVERYVETEPMQRADIQRCTPGLQSFYGS